MTAPLPATTILKLDRQGSRLYATIADPSTRNAMTAALVEDLWAVLNATENDRSLRTLILQGADGAFCAGADLKGTNKALDSAPGAGEVDPLEAQNRAGGELFAKLNEHPLAVIAVVDGPAFGGGFGMACCADIVLATPRARFALSETGLGIPPAQIAPYVVGRIGLRMARRLGLAGTRLDGAQAQDIGLVDFYCETADSLEATLTKVLNDIGRCAPGANAVTKRLFLSVGSLSPAAYRDEAARAFAGCLRGEEGQEGVRAFAEKRPARWVEKI
ncbi:enoyl-CoA hydratase/isomerase family protein [Chelatococcus reniformis]|uniref:Isohexenylglutaconyl-CoA hydratase n=1 Tax=Chelatococcus reniformis TaxID=1494448 RepID=A0A916XEI2_9HYPH|nr:enoyl-CoA hydratase/isomerase family protein [Chelatococcus reniformis]GGC68056.1 isohexenylglutaconyl-CoA hydratase [Chelatococcus reniformis]